MKRLLQTFDEVVAELGGVTQVAKLTGRGKSGVCNWRRKRNKFPTKHYIVMRDALAEKDAVAPLWLWGFPGDELRVDDAA